MCLFRLLYVVQLLFTLVAFICVSSLLRSVLPSVLLSTLSLIANRHFPLLPLSLHTLNKSSAPLPISNTQTLPPAAANTKVFWFPVSKNPTKVDYFPAERSSSSWNTGGVLLVANGQLVKEGNSKSWKDDLLLSLKNMCNQAQLIQGRPA